MFKLSKTLCIAVLFITFIYTQNAQACFTIVVGKDASATGEVLIGHNEDNDRKIVMAQYYVPRMKHKAGMLIDFEPAAAKIPQVRETYGYYWTQTLAPDGYSFSDGFINEFGVSIVSDNCISSKEDKPIIRNGGIGYGLRRLMAERAKTAREAVEIAIELLNTYGYIHPGRSYQIADKNEAWVLQVVKGNRYVARRLADNEIMLIANAYTLDKIDMNDKNNYIVSKDLITHAIEKGWYKPAKKGNYSDFSFKKAYQDDATRAEDYNAKRHYLGLKLLVGENYENYNEYPFAIVQERKITIDDLKKTLRGHLHTEPRDNGFYHQNMNDVCNISTQESVIIQIRPDPKMILAWRATGQPCVNPYVPIYPLAGVPAQQSWMTPEEAQKQHFHANPSNFSYDTGKAFWTYIVLQNILNFRHEDKAAIQNEIVMLEQSWNAETAVTDKLAATKLHTLKEETLISFLHNFNIEKAMQARAFVGSILRATDTHRITIGAEKLSRSDKGTVEVVLYSEEGFDASQVDVENTMMGIAHSNGNDELHTDLARPVESIIKDANGEGMLDIVFVFNISDLLKETFVNVKSDLYLFTYKDGKKIVAFDSVTVTE